MLRNPPTSRHDIRGSRMKKWLFGVLLVIASAAGGFWVSADKDMKALLSSLPTDANVLFWSIEQRDAAFRTMDRIPILAKANVIAKGDTVYPLPKGTPLTIATDVDAYMKAQRTAGLVIIHDGKVRMEIWSRFWSGGQMDELFRCKILHLDLGRCGDKGWLYQKHR